MKTMGSIFNKSFGLIIAGIVLLTIVTLPFTNLQAQAISVVHEETLTSTGTNVTQLESLQIDSGSNQLYVVAVANRSNRAVTSVSGLNLTWTLQKKQCSARNQQGLEVWTAYGNANSGAVTVTFATQTNAAVVSVSRYSGVDPSSPVESLAGRNTLGTNGVCTGGTDNTNALLTLQSTVDGSALYVATNSRNKTISTHDVDYAFRSGTIAGSGGDQTTMHVHDRILSFAGQDSANHTLSGNADWATVGLVIRPVAGTNTPTPSAILTPTITPTATQIPTATPSPTLIPTSIPSGSIEHIETLVTTGTNTNQVQSLVVDGGSNRLYVASIANRGNKTVSSVTGLGLTWTQQKKQCSGRSQQGLDIWTAYGNASTGSVTVSFATQTNAVVVAISSYSGVDPNNPVENPKGQNTLGANGVCSGGTDNNGAQLMLQSIVDGSVLFAVTNSRNRTISSHDADYDLRSGTIAGGGGDQTTMYTHDRVLSIAGQDTVNHSLSGTTDWVSAGIVINPN